MSHQSRFHIPDKPADRPTANEVAAVLAEYIKLPGRSVGGCVHVVVDDGNHTQGFADSCVVAAESYADSLDDEFIEQDREIAGLVAQLTNTQRIKLHRLYGQLLMPDNSLPPLTSLSSGLTTHQER